MFYNEVFYLPEFLKSIEGIFADYIFIDGGQDGQSDDGSIELIEKAGYAVHYKNWDYNWAETKNYGLSLVSTKWRIVLDTDEIMSRGMKKFVKEFAEGTDPIYCFAFFRDNFMDGGGQDDSPLDAPVRLFDDRVYYQGFTHEKPLLSGHKTSTFFGGRIYHRKDSYRQARTNLMIELILRGNKRIPNNKGAFWDSEVGKLRLVNLIPEERKIEWTNEYVEGPYLNI
jgi:glycosyltransferase involved in cell wall biosynthesis